MPHPQAHGHLAEFVASNGPVTGVWGELESYMTSLLKAWWGEAATDESDFCFDYLPRLTGDHSTYETVMAQLAGNCKGYFLLGENPAVGSANATMQRLGTANLDWRSLYLNYEMATFLYDRDMTIKLRALQQRYLDQSCPLDRDAWRRR